MILSIPVIPFDSKLTIFRALVKYSMIKSNSMIKSYKNKL